MRFALLGDHPDGLAMARALVASTRHELIIYSGSATGLNYLLRWALSPRYVGDLEEILADPNVEAVIVAGKTGIRPAQLRRALQSERHVLCSHPADDSPDATYEAGMLQTDAGCILLPLLPNSLHPGVERLAALLGEASGVGSGRLFELEIAASEAVLLDTESPGHEPAIPDWDVLRYLGGEIVEIVGLGQEEEVAAQLPLLLSGRFEGGGLFQMTLLPNQPAAFWRLRIRTAAGRWELEFPQGWPGPSRLTRPDDRGGACEENWPDWDPCSAMVAVFEATVAKRGPTRPSWQDEIRSLELDDAARRSVEKRRASTLEYQNVTEEAGFKGTMTLVGCALLWGSLLLLILSIWVPWLGWIILPVFGFFMVLQILRWVLPAKHHAERDEYNKDIAPRNFPPKR
jgi:predicted dehydrogenase